MYRCEPLTVPSHMLDRHVTHSHSMLAQAYLLTAPPVSTVLHTHCLLLQDEADYKVVEKTSENFTTGSEGKVRSVFGHVCISQPAAGNESASLAACGQRGQPWPGCMCPDVTAAVAAASAPHACRSCVKPSG